MSDKKKEQLENIVKKAIKSNRVVFDRLNEI